MRYIRTINAVNGFLATYIYAFNIQFAVDPESCENMFFKPELITNLDDVLCIKEHRIVDSGEVFSYGGKAFKVNEAISSEIIPKIKK